MRINIKNCWRENINNVFMEFITYVEIKCIITIAQKKDKKIKV